MITSENANESCKNQDVSRADIQMQARAWSTVYNYCFQHNLFDDQDVNDGSSGLQRVIRVLEKLVPES